MEGIVQINSKCFVDFDRYLVIRDDQEFPFSGKLQILLEYFIQYPNKVHSTEKIQEWLWSGDEVLGNHGTDVKNFISKLRKLLNDNNKTIIQNIYGGKYKFCMPEIKKAPAKESMGDDTPVLNLVRQYEDAGDDETAIACIKYSPEYLYGFNEKFDEQKYPKIAEQLKKHDYLHTVFIKLGDLYLRDFDVKRGNGKLNNLSYLLSGARNAFDIARIDMNKKKKSDELMIAYVYIKLATIEYKFAEVEYGDESWDKIYKRINTYIGKTNEAVNILKNPNSYDMEKKRKLALLLCEFIKKTTENVLTFITAKRKFNSSEMIKLMTNLNLILEEEELCNRKIKSLL